MQTSFTPINNSQTENLSYDEASDGAERPSLNPLPRVKGATPSKTAAQQTHIHSDDEEKQWKRLAQIFSTANKPQPSDDHPEQQDSGKLGNAASRPDLQKSDESAALLPR